MKETSILVGDCLDVLRDFGDKTIDSIVTDPPFSFAGGLSNGATSAPDAQFFEHWLSDVFKQLIRVTKDSGCMFIWCDWRTVSSIQVALARSSTMYRPWTVSQFIVHNREMIGMGAPFRNQCDFVAFVRNKKTKTGSRISKKTPNIFSGYSYYGKHKHHPSEKTLDVAKKLVCWACDEGETVLDPFCGSGTTILAAQETGRIGIGIEKDEIFANVAMERIHSAVPSDCPASYAPPCDRACPVGGERELTKEDLDEHE